MIWKRLKDNRCPECNAILMLSRDNYYRCSACSFKVREVRFNEIILGLYKPKSFNPDNEVEDNQRDLNNL